MLHQTETTTEDHKTRLKGFFDGLDREIEDAVEDHGNGLRRFFSGLSPVAKYAKRAQEKLDRIAATKFSVFEYFRERETDLSRIFADLLDPAGRHGQGERFLRLFLVGIHRSLDETLRREFPLSDIHQAKVHLEYPTDKLRRIDIVLEMPNNHWVGIENKPRAEEQEDQVKDYLKFLQDKVRHSGDGTAWMLYWSGDASSPKTLPDDTDEKKHCLTVPYQETDNESPSLENWVRQCWEQCEADRVRWLLRDLLEYISEGRFI
ncbi:MAG: PD-(D/E)XK nuclease family protein [Bryobacterales bacterium]|nr:PD-(D/E)XK nuclease family protein [Bryobacterales bacterium]